MFQITLKFLESVQRNNSTERLHTYRDLYQQEKKRFSDFMQKLLDEAKILNPHLEDLKVKDCIYRFNKDIRFSADKRPYKENFGGIIAYGGKKSWYPCFYFNLQPGNKSFVTGGVYYPSQINENKVRIHLLKHYDIWEGFLNNKKIMKYYHLDDAAHKYKSHMRLQHLIEKNPEVRKEISPIIKKHLNFNPTENEGIRISINQDESFKDFLEGRITMHETNEKIHKIINHLAYYKDWTFTHPLSDEEVSSPDIFDEVLKAYKLILPVIQFFEEAYDGPEYEC